MISAFSLLFTFGFSPNTEIILTHYTEKCALFSSCGFSSFSFASNLLKEIRVIVPDFPVHYLKWNCLALNKSTRQNMGIVFSDSLAIWRLSFGNFFHHRNPPNPSCREIRRPADHPTVLSVL